MTEPLGLGGLSCDSIDAEAGAVGSAFGELAEEDLLPAVGFTEDDFLAAEPLPFSAGCDDDLLEFLEVLLVLVAGAAGSGDSCFEVRVLDDLGLLAREPEELPALLSKGSGARVFGSGDGGAAAACRASVSAS